MRLARFALLLALSLPYAAFGGGSPVVLDVTDFGATGDGVTDDYDAMQAAATAICSSPAGSRLVYPPGTYRINRHRVFRGPSPNGVDDIVYENCEGVTISGYGATIDVKGEFHQGADFFDGQWYSYSKQVTPFFMLASSNFTIEGFELYGNVDKMTKHPLVLEDSCAGITTRHSSGYLLRDMNIHHFSVDGIQLGWLDFEDAPIADKDVRIENVNCHHNGRVGMALIHVRRVWVIDSRFTHSAETDGAFGGFIPEAGVDLEPDFTSDDEGIDDRTGEIYFINSTFSDNKGPELLAGFPLRVDTVAIYGANVVSAPGGAAAYGLVVGSKTAVMEKSTVDLRNGKGVLFGSWDSGPLSSIESVVFAKNLFQLSTNDGLRSEGFAAYDFIDNDVEVTAAGPDSSIMELTGLRKVAGNRVFIDGSGSAGVSEQIAVSLTATETVSGNEFRTDPGVAGQSLTAYYGDAGLVEGEMFPHAPHFVPADETNWDSNTPYPVPAAPPNDTAAPVISHIAALQFSNTTLISWFTDEAASSVVEYGPTNAYGSIAQLTDATRYHPVFLADLDLGATYHYRVKSTDAFAHTAVSADKTFTVPSVRAPEVTTTDATAITHAGATLNGTVHPGGASTTSLFEYGLDESYGSSIAGQTRTGATTQPISAAVSLTCSTVYHYRAVATNSAGIRYGADQTFTTPACPCTSFSINPTSSSPAFAAGSRLVTITGSPAGCAGGSWNASGNGSWLTVSPANGNGPGSTTVSWTQNPSPASRSGAATIGGNTFTVNQGGMPARTPGDFNWDGKSDIFWYHAVSGETYLWTMDGYTPLTMSHVNETSDLNWKIAGIGDFNGDGRSDVLWRHATSGENYMWLLDGATIVSAGRVNWTTDQNWKIAGTADHNGDGNSDILWRHATTGQNYLYLMNGLTIASAGPIPTLTDLGWKIAGSGDLNGDGKADIVWRHSTNGQVYAWLMNGFTQTAGGVISTVPDQNWTVAAVGDFDGNGKADLFWRHLGTGDNYLYLMNGATIAAAGVVNDVTDLNWKLVATGDYDGNGRTDVLWRHALTGNNYMYLMNGFTIVTATDPPRVPDTGWKVVR